MKRCLITGGSKGLGYAISAMFAYSYCHECQSDEFIKESPYYIHEFSRSEGIDITKSFPIIDDIDILILNAGVWEGEQLLPLYKATKNIALAYAPNIKHVIFILSNAAYQDYGNHDYTMVKSGLLHFARWLQKQYPKLKVSTISPGTMNTGFWNDAEVDNRKKGAMEPEVVAELVYSIIKAGEQGACVTEMIVLPTATAEPKL